MNTDAAGATVAPSWQTEIEEALDAFHGVMALTGAAWERSWLEVDYLPAPHTPPRSMPLGRHAVYAYWGSGEWLKIGKAGPDSGPRYTSHHYHLSASSSLARSLCNEMSLEGLDDLYPSNPGAWIREHCSRVSILLPATLLPEYPSFLEAFLHLRLHPRYEGAKR